MIKLESVTKKFDKKVILDSISFNINNNKIIGLLGKNGAGKTTLMRLITGYFLPDEGVISIFNKDISLNPIEVKKNIGYFPENCPLYDDMKVDEFLKYRARIKGVLPRHVNKRLRQVLKDCDISDHGKFLIKNLSKGYRQRVGLADSLIHNPKILVLDEPTAGLDPKQIKEFRTLIKELSKNHIIFLSSHIMHEIEVLCDEIIILDKGKIISTDRINKSYDKFNFSKNIYIELKIDILNFKKIVDELNYINVRSIKEIDDIWLSAELDLKDNKTSDTLSSDLFKKEIKVRILNVKKSNLENAFIELMN
ncbi:MAG: ABC transporter ATP-binding protein [Verrucomicrobiota bacterium]|nr:ABC transporter ATP-binding protein [Verrucomicrobiota bacterium]